MSKPVRELTTSERQLYADPAAAASQAVDKIAAARVWLLKEKPFFGVLARALQVEPSLATPAFQLTLDDKLRVNPLVVLELRFPALTARLAHLALHAALGVYARRGTREPLRWNVAHDLAIDPLLRAGGFHVGATLPDIDLPKGAAAEAYYEHLEQGIRPDDLWCDVSEPPPKEEAPPAGNFTRQDDGEGDDPGAGGAQGGESGRANSNGKTSDDDESDAGDEEPSSDADEEPSPVEARGRELQWKMRLAAAMEEEAASGNKTFGDTPAWIEELVQATLEPLPDWSAVLQRSISALARSERSFLRPSRRMAAIAELEGHWPDSVVMPGRRVVAAGHLVAVVDTSASIDAADLSRFFGALVSVASAEGFDEIRLVQADAAVVRDEVVLAADLLLSPVKVEGRGGTDFSPALLMLANESKDRKERFTVVYLTDLDGRFPPAEAVRDLEVLWVVPRRTGQAAPFGRVLEMAARRTVG